MSPIFKALTPIVVWILFICGCISYLTTTINWFVCTGLICRPDITALIGWGLSNAQFIFSGMRYEIKPNAGISQSLTS